MVTQLKTDILVGAVVDILNRGNWDVRVEIQDMDIQIEVGYMWGMMQLDNMYRLAFEAVELDKD